ncbi:MAG: class II histone deacetylase [Pseudomonadota bacterium]
MANVVQVYWHPDCFKHDTGRGCYDVPASPLIEIDEPHPETAERLINIKSILEKGPIHDRLNWNMGTPVERQDLEAFVDPAYLDRIYQTSDQVRATGKSVRIDGTTTIISAETLSATRAAAGCALGAMRSVLSGGCDAAYALIRPPGHHASRTLPDGYCLVNNIGVAVEHARKTGVEKIAVLDWDVHHGNGTQAGFYDRDDVFTISTHMPLGSWGDNHPELGTVEEVGEGAGKGFNLNIPLPYGSGDQAYKRTMEKLIAPAIDQFQPDLLVIANGQDANQFDLNGRNLLSMRGFRALGRAAKAMADKHCDGRLLLVQEGGYAVTYTAFCAYAVLEGVLGIEDVLHDPVAYPPSIEQVADLDSHLDTIRTQWERASGKSLS